MYTTQGYMTAADYADYRASTDTGNTRVDVADLGLTDEALTDSCPECGDPLGEHDYVIVDRASGDIVDCDY